ncbi:hypothetical protein [Phytomonospora endophytica]|uniref:Uncharacterized protein n=1 Tax=Phytomonospora endophytica TaxID=714109 RepID=A0A841FKS7_9ACTN|nr:hypothetical protein [Phytomonospora endophytica]MBB6036766.1 hypothetical protein [Phytomonospora endophytica]GIG68200.1 hypothetical protein Pen01_44950 [Phytomonospora endophytica]
MRAPTNHAPALRLSPHARPGTKAFLTVVLPALIAGAVALADIAYRTLLPAPGPPTTASPASSTTSSWDSLIVAAAGCAALLAVLRRNASRRGPS